MTIEGPPVDFYAAASAAAAVVVFAKFVTHRGHGQVGTCPWNGLHRACVGAAWTAFVASFFALGALPSGRPEFVLRWAVGVLLGIAATILALDVNRLERGAERDPARSIPPGR
jgi:hypothetical protein